MAEAQKLIGGQDGVLAAGAVLLRFEGLTLDLAGRTLTSVHGHEICLTRAEFDLLSVLIRGRGRAFSRDQLLDAVAGRRAEPFDRSVDVLIGRLRRKIEPESKVPRLILTLPGHGYKFAAKPVQVVAEQEETSAPEVPAAEPSAALAKPVPERRQLTVMVCSVSGATGSSIRLDPEERHELFRAFRTCSREICGRFGGVPGTITCDSVQVTFGYPAAHEHDVEQAIRAGLAVVAAVERLDFGSAVPPKARIGIATGEAVAKGEPGEISSEAFSLAPELAASAASGTVVVGATTRCLAGGLFEYRAISTGQESFQVLGEAAVATRFDALHPGGLTPLVGRREEVGLLLNRWRRAQTGGGNVVLFSGEPGIGKSRLVREMRSRLAEMAHVPLICYCAPHQRDSPYHPFIQHLEHAAGFARLDDVGARLAKLKALLTKSGSDPETLALFADLLSIPTDGSLVRLSLSPQQRRERTAAALTAQVVAAPARTPVLLVVEDAQWMDRTSLEVLDEIVDRVTDLPVLLIVTFRPEFTPPWSSHPQATVLVLNRLDCGAARQMVDQVSGGAMPDSLSQRIIAQADGIPLFLEELTKAMLEGGTSLPATLHDSLMERLDRLPAAKRVAQLGAAIGRSFSHDVLAPLSGMPEQTLCSALGQLVSTGLVARRGLPPDATYTFKHALVQTAAYESMLKSQRTAIHEKIVELLLALEPNIEGSRPDLLGYHCELASLVEKAAAYYIQAGWRSNYHAAYADSCEQFRNALRLAATLPEGEERDLVELRALRGVGLTMGNIEGYGSVSFGSANLRALELCDRVGQPPEFLGINFGISVFQFYRSDLCGGLKTAERLLRWGQLRGDIRGCILGEFVAGRATTQCGTLAAARSHLQRAAELLESTRDDPAIIWTFGVAISRAVAMYNIHSTLSRVLCLMGYAEQALTHSSAAVEPREEEVRVVMEPMRLWQRLWVLSVLGDARELVALAEKMAELSCRHKLPLFGATAAIMLGYGIAHSGQPEAGQSAICDGLAAYTSTGAVTGSCYYRALLAETHRMMGETDAALSILGAALEETKRTGEKCYDAELHRGIGEAHCQRGDIQAAEQSFRRALAVARAQGARLWELNAATSYARLLHGQGEYEQAYALLAPIYGWFSEGFGTGPLRRARLLLDGLRAADRCRPQVFRQP
jgi:DNA-binding winged helix-turn-helix (wHTH) protein/tetratricopeptide (TPR) repeat protein